MNQPLKFSEEEQKPRPYKIQRPLAGNGPFFYLVYPRKRTPTYQLAGPSPEIDKLMGPLPKIYVLANFTAEGVLKIHHVLPMQDF